MKKERNSVIASRKIEHGIVKAEDGLLAAFMLVLTFSIIFQVVCRYVLKVSSPWCEELARYLFIAMTYIGSGRAFINNGHIGIDLMDTIVDKKSKDPEKFMKIFNRFSEIITLAFIVLYNLTNINVIERTREIASLKVLGFTRREVSAYVFREVVLLVAIGSALCWAWAWSTS